VPSQIRALVSGIEDRLHAEKVAGSVRVLENKMLPDDLQVLARTIMSAVNSGQMQKTGKLVSENMLFVDGACRKDYSASIGGVLLQPNKEVVMISRLVGKATSNQAEYQALIAGLEQVKEFGITDIDCFTDSQLMAKQLVGTFKVQSAQLRPLFVRAKQLMDDIGNVRIHHVKREENVGAHNLAQMAFNDLV